MSRMRDPHADMGVGVGGIVGFKVEEHRPEDDPAWLAIRLAEALHNASLHQQDADSFKTNVLAERQKAMQIQQIIFQLEERKRQKAPPKPSRMDPLNTYDLDHCKAELKLIKERAAEFGEKVNEFMIKAEQARRDAQRFQRLLRKANSKKRQI